MRARIESPSEGEKGIALVLVLLVLLLTSVLALEIKSSAFLYSKLARNKRDDFLMQQAMDGQIVILKEVLLYDSKENQIETLGDVWNQDRYTNFQKGPSEEDQQSDQPREEPVSSREYQTTAKIEDENRKFPLQNLEVTDDAQRKIWETIFIRLLVHYRENDGAHAISQSDAESCLQNLKEWIARPKDDHGIPRPATATDGHVLVTPDELLMVKGFTRDMFYDLPPDHEGEEVIPGLYHYLTLWSDGRVNLNTADPAMVRAMFTDQDQDLAENFLAWREEDAEKQPENADPDADPKKNALKAAQDLANVDGFDAEAIQRNNLATTTVFAGNVFSIDMIGEASGGLRRQQRWIIQRNSEGCKTLLTEERNDPVPEKKQESQ
jgi:type II secretory pathway component PulK